jgi:integrase
VTRREALKWSKLHKHNAVVVCAMFNDAIDDDVCKTNPFAGRRQEESRERKHIHPLTEEEVDRLADIALRHWGERRLRAGRARVGAVRRVGGLQAG